MRLSPNKSTDRHFFSAVNLVHTALLITLAAGASASAASPENWSPVVVPTGEYRQRIQATPIPDRPGRPLHVYGNTIRYFHQLDRQAGFGRPARHILWGTGSLSGRRALGSRISRLTR